MVVSRLASPVGARTLSMDAVCTALKVLRSAKQLASYNKASGTILKSFTHDGGSDAGEEAQLAGADPPLLCLLCYPVFSTSTMCVYRQYTMTGHAAAYIASDSHPSSGVF